MYDCYQSRWWTPAAAEVGAPFPAAWVAPDDAALFAGLGGGDLPANAKLFFCLCEVGEEATRFRAQIDKYSASLQQVSEWVLRLGLITLLVLVCFTCWWRDTDRYWDPELL